MYFYKQVVDFFLFLYLRSTEAVKKGQIVKDPGISTFKKRARLETFGWKKKTLGKRVHLEALLSSSNRSWKKMKARQATASGLAWG